MSSEVTFEYVVKSTLMPAVSLFGLVGNSLSIYILHHKEVKLKRDFVEVLCSLATFDNLLLISTFFLFSLPTLSGGYDAHVFPYTVPYLYPTCNTFMTCSIYMTVGVAVNRYLDISDSCRQMRRIKSGYMQASIVFVMSVVVNIPRWFEFDYEIAHETVNVTSLAAGEATFVEVNQSRVVATPTLLRQNDEYIRDYTLISATVLIVLLPMIIMMVSSILIYRTMEANASISVFSDAQEQARRRRNRSITLMLFGIIFLFLLCHVGEVFISFYELINVIYGERSAFPAWARNTVTINHLLVVMNSSLNFVIYCKVSISTCFWPTLEPILRLLNALGVSL
jgi:hypothetical protein